MEKTGALNVQLNGEKMEELDSFGYLGVELSSDGGMEAEWKHRVGEGRKVAGALDNIWKRRKISRGKYGYACWNNSPECILWK